jgi:hypothetical protein
MSVVTAHKFRLKENSRLKHSLLETLNYKDTIFTNTVLMRSDRYPLRSELPRTATRGLCSQFASCHSAAKRSSNDSVQSGEGTDNFRLIQFVTCSIHRLFNDSVSTPETTKIE